MHGQALALPPQNNRVLRVDDSASQGYADYELGAPERGVDLGALAAIVYRYRWMMLAILIAALAVGVASILFVTPTYRAVASLEIQPQTVRVTGAENLIPDPGRTETDRQLQTQVDLISSASTVQHVADRLGISSDQRFLREAGLADEPAGRLRDAEAVGALQERLSVSSPGTTRIVTIGIDSRDPVFAANAANLFARTFIDDSLQRRLDTYADSRKILEGQLSTTKQRLEDVERRLVQYARASGLVDAGNAAGVAGNDGERRSIVTASLVSLNTALSAAEAERMRAQERWRQAEATPAMSLPEVLANPAIQELTRRRAELTATLEQERARRQDAHPAIVQARAQIREMNSQIATIAGGIRSSIANQYRVAAGHEAALRGDVNALKAASFEEQSKGVRYNILKREADTQRNLYNALLQRYHEISTEASNHINPISLIDPAQVPITPVSPRPALNMALASLAGLLLAFGAAFGRNRLDRKMHGPSEAERELQTPLLGVVPVVSGEGDLTSALHDPRSAMSEAHHSIGLALKQVAQAGAHGVILLTSANAGEGKSTTALKLATQAAAGKRKVLLIDGDMRRGSLHRMLGLSVEPGLANILSSGSGDTLASSIHRQDAEGAWVLTRGRSAANPAELLSSESFERLLAEARGRFDVVIIDGPPVLGLADAPRLAGLADATVFLVEANRTSKEHARIALRRLAEAGATQIGLVMAKYDPARDEGRVGYAHRYDYPSDDEEPIETGGAVESRSDQPQLVF